MQTTRLLAALLALSAAGNLALLWRAARPAGDAAAHSADATNASAFGTHGGPSAPPSGAPLSTTVSPETAEALRSAFAARDLSAFRDLLDAAGVEPELRRALLLTTLQHRYAERFDAINPDLSATMLREWWRNPTVDEHTFAYAQADHERIAASQRLQRELQAEFAALTGQDMEALDFEHNTWLARRYLGLPPDKVEALRAVERDYEELEQEVHLRSMNFPLPSDQEKLRLLREERERDIAALLSPEERAEWELRASPSADSAREHATRYRATEEEYRRIFELQKTFDAKFGFDPFAPAPREVDWQARQAAEKSLEQQIRAIVGEERYLAAKRTHDQDYTLARAAAQRLGLPATAADSLLGLRESAAAESRRLAADPALGPEQRRAALAGLAATNRARLVETLGEEAAATYLERGGMSWLSTLEDGSPLDPDDDESTTLGPRGVLPVEPVEPPVPTIRID